MYNDLLFIVYVFAYLSRILALRILVKENLSNQMAPRFPIWLVRKTIASANSWFGMRIGRRYSSLMSRHICLYLSQHYKSSPISCQGHLCYCPIHWQLHVLVWRPIAPFFLVTRWFRIEFVRQLWTHLLRLLDVCATSVCTWLHSRSALSSPQVHPRKQ